MTTCSVCEKELANALDTFGDIYYPVCQECWLELSDPRGEYNYAHIVECGTCRRNFLAGVPPIRAADVLPDVNQIL